jgi:hypothetical protein
MVARTITNTTAALIPTAVDTLVETPRNGQMPKNWARTIFETRMAEIMMTMYSMTV